MRPIIKFTALVVAVSLVGGCAGGSGRSASKAGDGLFDDRNALEPSPCACVSHPQTPPDDDFYARLQQG